MLKTIAIEYKSENLIFGILTKGSNIREVIVNLKVRDRYAGTSPRLNFTATELLPHAKATKMANRISNFFN